MPVDGEAAEAVCELFDRYGGGAVVEISVSGPGEARERAPRAVVRTYLRPDDVEARAKIEIGLWHLAQIHPIPEAAVRPLAAANWAEAWKAHYTPQRIGRRILIVPSWLESESVPDDLVLRLDPGMAFGTGLHPTTRLCLVALEELVAPGDRVLDVGTGSGILALAAARLGAGTVVACDIDPAAAEAARANAQANGLRVQVVMGSLDAVPPGVSAVVVANLLAGIVRDLATPLASRVAPGGVLIASGILEDQVSEVDAALGGAGLIRVGLDQTDDWVALRYRAGALALGA